MRDQDADETTEDEERTVLTARLRLRRPRTEDAAILAAAIDNPRIAMNLVSVPHPYRRADAEAWMMAGRSLDDAAHVAVSRQSDSVIGAGFHRPSPTRPGGHELSFFVAERFWGEGFGTEIAHATIDHAFGAGRIERLWCSVRVTNAPARRVVAKCGFQFRDTGMVRSLAAGGAVPVEHFVLERRIWQSLKSWGATAATDFSATRGADAAPTASKTRGSEDDDTSHAA